MVKVTVNVTGMMCGHCEAHVNKAIQEAFGVQDVVSSHDAGTTIFSAPEKVDEDKIRAWKVERVSAAAPAPGAPVPPPAPSAAPEFLSGDAKDDLPF